MIRRVAENVFLLEELRDRVCSNVYILEGKQKVLLIDSGVSASRIVLDKPIECVLFTHGHFDHVLAALEAKWKGLMHKSDLSVLTRLNQAFVKVRRPDFFNVLPPQIKFDNFFLEVIHTPGHTPGSVCFLDKKRGLLFSGDTLFAKGFVGRTDLWGGSKRALKDSLGKINSLDFNVLCPGHGQLEIKDHSGKKQV